MKIRATIIALEIRDKTQTFHGSTDEPMLTTTRLI